MIISLMFLCLILPKKSMVALWNIFQCWTSGHEIPDCIVVLIKDIQEESLTYTSDVDIPSRSASGFMSICYHNKGIEMINLPRILNSRYLLFKGTNCLRFLRFRKIRKI